jgi:hypothetical protein
MDSEVRYWYFFDAVSVLVTNWRQLYINVKDNRHPIGLAVMFLAFVVKNICRAGKRIKP